MTAKVTILQLDGSQIELIMSESDLDDFLFGATDVRNQEKDRFEMETGEGIYITIEDINED